MAVSIMASTLAGPSSSGTQSPATPLKAASSSPSRAGLKTPMANSSLLENDSPLPSPPSISKPPITKTAGSLSSRPTFSSLGDDIEDDNKENAPHRRPRTGSPSPAPGSSKGRYSGTRDDDLSNQNPRRSPRAVSLAEALGAPGPTSSNRNALEQKLGIRAMAGTSRVASSSARLNVDHDEHQIPSTSSRNGSSRTVSHTRTGSNGNANSLRSARAAHPPTSSSSTLLARSREGTVERTSESKGRTSESRGSERSADSLSRKRRSPEEGAWQKQSAPDEVVESFRPSREGCDDEYNGKSSGGSDSGPRSSSPHQGQTDSAGSTEQRAFTYSTPALAPGARSMRSVQTAGRSTGRTLRRYAAGDARPVHIRPTRVMLVQGADDTDGEEDDENLGVGPAPSSANNEAAPDKGNGAARSPVQPSFRHQERSPSSLLRDSDPAQSGRDSHAARNQEAQRATSPLPGVESGAREEMGARRRRVAAEKNAHPHKSNDVARVPSASRAAREQDGEVEGISEGRPPPPNRKEIFPLSGRVASVADGPSGRQASSAELQSSRQSKCNITPSIDQAASRQPSGDLRSAKAQNIEEGRPSPRASPRALSPQADSSQSRAQLTVETEVGRLQKSGENSPSRVGQARIAELEPDIEAEKNRLLELNGWDRYVHAALEEAQRQRHNGCKFAENPVGKVLANQKETKFRGAKYLKVSRAGEGGFSTVFQVVGPVSIPTIHGGVEPVPPELQAHFAMKQVSLKKLEQSSRDELLQEAELLETLAQVDDSDRYVLRYFGHKHSGDTLKILMELGEMDFNTLLRTQHPLSRSALSEYWRQMLESVHFVHNAKLVHSDLKPANFLMVKGRVKLIDFGIAQKIPLGTVHISRDVIVGTPNYMAPEAIQKARRGGHGVYKAGKASDVWSLGCILYQMIYGRTPFAHISGDRKLEVITNPKHSIAFPTQRTLDENTRDGESDDRADGVEEMDDILIDCVKSALVYDSTLRAKIPQLLEHAFVRDEVTLSRKKLKSIVSRIQSYMQQGRLTEDNVDEIADRLVTNLQLEGFRAFDPEQD
ncbi:unnamed protein product [Sympodiomycopsis kandeliae]